MDLSTVRHWKKLHASIRSQILFRITHFQAFGLSSLSASSAIDCRESQPLHLAKLRFDQRFPVRFKPVGVDCSGSWYSGGRAQSETDSTSVSCSRICKPNSGGTRSESERVLNLDLNLVPQWTVDLP
ncbi:hypothetical protein LINPERPRIM_LOCUS20705 [Linum perenne]